MCHTGYADVGVLKEIPQIDRKSVGYLRDFIGLQRFKEIFNTEEMKQLCIRLYGMTPEEVDNYRIGFK